FRSGRGRSPRRAGLTPRPDLDDHRRAHTAADAECGDSTSTATGSKRVDERGENTGPARANRVSQRNRTATYVDLGQIEAELAGNGQRLRGERLVQLKKIDV